MKTMLLLLIVSALFSCQNKVDNAEDMISEEIEFISYEDSMYTVCKDKIHFEWIDDFSREEKVEMRNWLIETTVSVQTVLGNYPFRMEYFLHRVESESAPVTFGYTKHKFKKDMHVYVDPSHDIELIKDHWIAPHEISHMAIPSIGKNNAWFAEGFATFMSRQIMMEMGIYTEEEIEEEYLRKILEFKSSYDRDEPFVEVVLELRDENKYSHFYWGGVSFFYSIDHMLKDEYEQTLCSVIREYQKCCRLKDNTLDEIISSFDEISGSHIFTDLLDEYRTLSARELFERFE